MKLGILLAAFTGLATLTAAQPAAAATLAKCDKGTTNQRLACLQKNIELLAGGAIVTLRSEVPNPQRCLHNDRNVATNMTDCSDNPGVQWRIVVP